MTEQELQQKIDELQKQLDELKNVKIEEKQKKWKPAVGEKYYSIGHDGSVDKFAFDDASFDNDCVKLGNCFATREEAQFVADKIKYTQKFRRYVEEYSDELDWENENQTKWHIAYDFEEHHIEINFDEYFMSQGTIYASSKKILEDAIAYVGEDEVKKYILEVEE